MSAIFFVIITIKILKNIKGYKKETKVTKQLQKIMSKKEFYAIIIK